MMETFSGDVSSTEGGNRRNEESHKTIESLTKYHETLRREWESLVTEQRVLLTRQDSSDPYRFRETQARLHTISENLATTREEIMDRLKQD